MVQYHCVCGSEAVQRGHRTPHKILLYIIIYCILFKTYRQYSVSYNNRFYTVCIIYVYRITYRNVRSRGTPLFIKWYINTTRTEYLPYIGLRLTNTY